jgi:hypothetical protein
VTIVWHALTAFWLIGIASVCAQELPTDLWLQCDGESSSLITTAGVRPVSSERRFSTSLRLRNGSIGDIRHAAPDGQNCRLVDDVIQCELASTTYDQDSDSTERSYARVSVSRTTGEYKYTLEMWSYPGKGGTEDHTASLRMTRTGVCRTIKPLF